MRPLQLLACRRRLSLLQASSVATGLVSPAATGLVSSAARGLVISAASGLGSSAARGLEPVGELSLLDAACGGGGRQLVQAFKTTQLQV